MNDKNDTEKMAQALRIAYENMDTSMMELDDIALVQDVVDGLDVHETARAQPARDQDMRYFAASDAACIHYPGADQAALRDAYCRGASEAQPASVADGFKLALEQIKALPLRPFPDPVGHSWEAFGRAVMSAFTDARRISVHALDAAPQPQAKENDDGQ